MSELTRFSLKFDDNHLLATLCGVRDQHLARIEQQLGVLLRARGSVMIIEGSPEPVQTARVILNLLWSRLGQGLAVDLAEVDAALRMTKAQSVAVVAAQSRHLRTPTRVISPRSPGQVRYLEALENYDLVFCSGPAGTGKTYLAVAQAVSMLGRVQRIILSRPAVEAGEKIGFLPGDMREKIDPYLRPLYDALHDMLPAAQVARKLDSGEIEIAPLAFMRGRTIENAFVILDEAQNTTPSQLKMFLTRLGCNSRMVVAGDITQIDLPAASGLIEALATLSEIAGIGFVELDSSDVMRHPLVGRIVQAYAGTGRIGCASPDTEAG